MASVSSDASGDDVLYATSRRRQLLVADIKAGKHQGMQPKELWLSRPEYQQDKLTLFCSCFYSLQSTIEATDRNERDEKAFVDNKKLGIGTKFLPYPKFKGSNAEELLKKDLDEGVNKTMLPQDIHKLHLGAYAPWPLEVFRNHIYQELQDRKQRLYWLGKRKEKEEKKIKKAKAAVKKNQAATET
jgi:sRNA-binding carbon storage regulator CsrA